MASNTSSISTTTISSRNSTESSAATKQHRKASLLLHPHGLKLLEFYSKFEEAGADKVVAKKIAETLITPIEDGEHEPKLSSALVEIFQQEWAKESTRKSEFSVAGERKERVCGKMASPKETASGDPDLVVRIGDERGKVAAIFELSVDKKSGERKVHQAFDYASAAKPPNDVMILFSLHVNRLWKKKNVPHGDTDRRCDVRQYAWIFLRKENEDEGKMGFLWREIYNQKRGEELSAFLETCSMGIVRCLRCTEHLSEISSEEVPNWCVVSDNVAIENEATVYKIFDNRYHQTYRKPDAWLCDKGKERWCKGLEVKERFRFKESESSETAQLGVVDAGSIVESPKVLPYGSGQVLIIQYNYIKGTHLASKVSHFVDIAKQIKEMHDEGFVHGDIRGFNMLHPFAERSQAGETSNAKNKSRLIDFDLSGKPGKDRYPPGYAKYVGENINERAGVAGGKLKCEDDWKDLASVMYVYKPKKRDLIGDWIDLCAGGVNAPADFSKALEHFSENREYEEVVPQIHEREDLLKQEKGLVGTGSPNKNSRAPGHQETGSAKEQSTNLPPSVPEENEQEDETSLN